MERESAALFWRDREQALKGVEVLGEADDVGREWLRRRRQQHLSPGRGVMHRANQYVGMAHKYIGSRG